MATFEATYQAWCCMFGRAIAIPLGLFALVCATPALGTDWTFNWGTAVDTWRVTGFTNNAWPACGTTGTVSNSRTYTNVNASSIDVKATITITAGCFRQ